MRLVGFIKKKGEEEVTELGKFLILLHISCRLSGTEYIVSSICSDVSRSIRQLTLLGLVCTCKLDSSHVRRTNVY